MRTICSEALSKDPQPPLKDLWAVILAGGQGTRLRSVVADRPKVMAPVLGRPFLEILLKQIKTVYITQVILSTGYMAEQIEAYFGTHWEGMSLRYSREDRPLGTGGALRLAARLWLKEAFRKMPLLVLNGDSYIGADLESAYHWHSARKAIATILLADVPDVSRYGRILIDGQGAVESFKEKEPAACHGAINAGVYFIDQEGIRAIPDCTPCSLEKEVFPGWIGKGLHGFAAKGPFLDIGQPESYAIADRFFS